MKLELTNEEAQALTALINFAVQSQGLRVAETAVVLVKKIEAAARTDVVLTDAQAKELADTCSD